VLQERKAAADNLRRCLIRKRVAFKLFRNWYWESFDDEMQVCGSLHLCMLVIGMRGLPPDAEQSSHAIARCVPF